MTEPQLPRFFVPRAARSAARTLRDELFPAMHALDAFTLGARHVDPREWAVVLHAGGGLRLVPRDERAALPANIQAELAGHDVARGGGLRGLDATELYLFDMQLLEQPPEALGPFDPVHLYGTLSGPFPSALHPDACAVEGHLIVTRADVLDGLLRGAHEAFRYAVGEGAGSSAAYALHMLLPAANDDELRSGRGVVLAYPLMPAEIALGDAANEVLVNQLFYDVLSALQEGARRANADHPLRTAVLPVPSRALLVAKLEADGYTVKGDTAVRRAGGDAKGFAGVLASVFGGINADRVTLPPEGTCADFLALARATLDALPRWPSPRAVALRERVLPPGATPARAAPSPPAPAYTFAPRTARPLAPSAAPPPVKQAPAKPAVTTAPGWMKDFDSAPEATENPEGATTPQADAEPDWMKDFK